MPNTMFLRRSGASAVALACALLLSTPALAEHPPEAAQTNEAAAPDATASGIEAWGITDAELQADPGVIYGVLDNGMRYALKRNTQPQGGASMRLLFDVGTRDEADDEEGAAHFVEHMAFNGSKGIPEGELVPILERLGLAFGADTNAETYPHYTMYKLDLPKLDEETVGSAFNILREMASELTIAPDAVEREKGIVVSEYQVRNSPIARRSVQIQRDIMATSRLPDRAVAEPDAIRSLTAETLRGFYEGYYRPEKATLVIVGDIEIADMERRIGDAFASWAGKGEARPNYEPRLAKNDGVKTSIFVEPGITEVAEMYRLTDYKDPTNSREEFLGQLLDLAATVALNTRFATLNRAEGAKAQDAVVIVQDLGQAAQMYGMVGVAKGGDWRGAVQTVEQEWRRAAQFGFTNSEVAQAKAAIESSLATAAAQSNSATSAGIASNLALTSINNSVRQSPEQALVLYRELADLITPETTLANFRARWGEGPTYAQVASQTAIDSGEAMVAEALAASSQLALAAPEETAEIAFAYTDFGPAGTVTADETIEDLGIRTVSFANGVQLNLKRTDFEPGSVTVQVEVGTGTSRLSGRTGINVMAQILAGADDLGQHTVVELSQILAGKQVGYGYALGGEAVAMTRSTTPQDLQLQLQLIAAQLTDTAFSAQAQRQWEGVVPILETNLESGPQGVFNQALESILTGGDPRFGFTDAAVLGKLTMDDLKAVVGSQFASGHVEIGVVGDFDEDAVIAAVASTLGAIDRTEAEAGEPAPVTFRTDRTPQVLFHKGEPDQGMISLSWPTTDGFDQRSALTRRVLAELIRLEALKVLREELGATYTPTSRSSASSVHKGFGYFSLYAPAEPGTMDEVAKVIRTLVAGFSEKLPSADDMQRARQPIIESYERSDASNSSWAAIVVDAQTNPERLEERRQRAAMLASITPEEVLAAAKQYLTAEPVEFRVIPELAETEGS